MEIQPIVVLAENITVVFDFFSLPRLPVCLNCELSDYAFTSTVFLSKG